MGNWKYDLVTYGFTTTDGGPIQTSTFATLEDAWNQACLDINNGTAIPQWITDREVIDGVVQGPDDQGNLYEGTEYLTRVCAHRSGQLDYAAVKPTHGGGGNPHK